MLNVLIVDDEPLAHDVLKHHLQGHADVRVKAQCYNATEALSWLAGQRADLIFLDINMPALSGMDMLRVLANKPQVVIVSAYQEYALEGFELDVTDYLLKPVSAARLAQALDKVRARMAPQAEPVVSHILVKVDRHQQRLALADMVYLEAYGNYVKVWQQDGMLLVNSSLKALLEQLPDEQFVQIHKSFAVNRQHVTAVASDNVTLSTDVIVKIGKSYRGARILG
ncbi:LytTR family DNA-binding domain-containing protein [Bowmanella sp. JS7-9]|uniref:LytR/AlgR family response regulator transcription factor n=1 Tax=Pseudobowmanella zhangzhouensis TaxID=1537679 RepID=A0ABW1XN44_9ALTE|nr:response regulator [Bowmanella sp. JS7-9]TBX23584.1 transcriptional regulator [Bowmanella sp. JS7-9]